MADRGNIARFAVRIASLHEKALIKIWFTGYQSTLCVRVSVMIPGPTIHATSLLAFTLACALVLASHVQAYADDETESGNWNGAYLGIQLGSADAGSGLDVCDRLQDPSCFSDREGRDFGSLDLQGIGFGGYVGTNFQMGSVILGLELDLNYQALQGESASSNQFSGGEVDVSSQWQGSLRARAGFASGPALFYVTGGPSLMSEQLRWPVCDQADAPGVTCGGTGSQLGFVLGAGGEMALSQDMSLKLEYLHGWFNDAELPIIKGPMADFNLEQDLQTDVVRAGMAYHFN